MQFTISHIEPGPSPGTQIVKGQFSCYMGIVVDASAEPVTAITKPSAAGMQCDATRDAVASAIANAINLVGLKNVERLQGQGIPVDSPVRKPAPVTAAAPDTEPDEDGPTIGPDVTGDVALSAAESVSERSVVSGAPLSQPTSPPAPAVAPMSPQATAAAPVA